MIIVILLFLCNIIKQKKQHAKQVGSVCGLVYGLPFCSVLFIYVKVNPLVNLTQTALKGS